MQAQTELKDMRGKRKSRVPLIERNFRAKLLRRRWDSDQSAAMHPGSVNAALSAFTSPSLPSLSLTSFKATHEAHIKAVMEYISPFCERWGLGRVQSHLTERGKTKKSAFRSHQPDFLLSKEEVVEPRPSVIGPYRPAPRLIRWLDRNFVKGMGCFLCWLNISV